MSETYLWTGAVSRSLQDGANWLDQDTGAAGTAPGMDDQADFSGNAAVSGSLAVAGLSSTAAGGDGGFQLIGTLSVTGTAAFTGDAQLQQSVLDLGTALELDGSGAFVSSGSTVSGEGALRTIDVGDTAASTGGYRLDVVGGLFDAAGAALNVGNGQGAVCSATVENGGTLIADSASLGSDAGFGVLQVLGGSVASFGDSSGNGIVAGSGGFGGINVFGLSSLSAVSLILGPTTGGITSDSYGVLRIAASVVGIGYLNVGSDLYGLVQVGFGGTLTVGSASIGFAGLPDASGALDCSASSVTLDTLNLGNGSILIDDSGSLSGVTATIGGYGGAGVLQVLRGSQASFGIPSVGDEGVVRVGENSAYGSIGVSGLSSLTTGSLVIGDDSGASSPATSGFVQVEASVLDVLVELDIGNAGTGLVQAGYGSLLRTGNVVIGNDASGGVGTLLAEGAETQVLLNGSLGIASGQAEVGYGAFLDCSAAGSQTAISVGVGQGDNAALTLGLASADVTGDTGLLVGGAGTGDVQIVSSAVTFGAGGSGTTFVGVGSTAGPPASGEADGSGTLSIGVDASVVVDGAVAIGNAASGVLDISNTSTLTAASLAFGSDVATGSGTLSEAGVASIAGAVTLGEFSTLTLTGQGTALHAQSLQAALASRIGVADGAVVSVGSASLMGDFVLGGGGSALSVAGTLGVGLTGGMLDGAGSVTAPVIQLDGAIAADGGTLSVAGDIMGHGTLVAGSGATLVLTGGAGGVPGGQAATIQFMSDATVQADAPSALTERIAGWGSGDLISLTGVDATYSDYANGVLTLSNAENLLGILSFDMGGSYTQANFTVSATASGGTTIAFHG